MANDIRTDGEVEVLKTKIVKLEERMAGLEKAYVQLNEMYNKHIAGLHVH